MTLSYLALAGFAVAFVVTAWTTPVVGRLAVRRGWTDRPDGGRKLHLRVTPSIGGLAIFGGSALGAALVAWAGPHLGLQGTAPAPLVVVGAGVMVLTGIVDDVRGLGFKAKLAVEVAVASGLVYAGHGLDPNVLVSHGGQGPVVLAAALSVVWIVGVVNAVNLVDGVDGLAAGVVAISVVTMATVFGLGGSPGLVAVAAVLVGALGGFLVHNFAPASIFMGDSGSLFLGYALAVYTLAEPASPHPSVALAVPVLAVGLPVLDTLLSVVRRAVGRRAICAPDRDHIHHRMVDRMPTRQAVLVLYAVSAMFGALAVLASASKWTGGTAVAAAATALVVGLLVRLGYVRLPYAPPKLRTLEAQGTADPGPSLAGVGDRSVPAIDGELTGSGDGIPSLDPHSWSEPVLRAPS